MDYKKEEKSVEKFVKAAIVFSGVMGIILYAFMNYNFSSKGIYLKGDLGFEHIQNGIFHNAVKLAGFMKFDTNDMFEFMFYSYIVYLIFSLFYHTQQNLYLTYNKQLLSLTSKCWDNFKIAIVFGLAIIIILMLVNVHTEYLLHIVPVLMMLGYAIVNFINAKKYNNVFRAMALVAFVAFLINLVVPNFSWISWGIVFGFFPFFYGIYLLVYNPKISISCYRHEK